MKPHQFERLLKIRESIAKNKKDLVDEVKNVKKKYAKSKTHKKRKKVYSEFLNSNYWKSVKANVLVRDNNSCVNCNSKKRLEVHHKTYKNHGKEHLRLEDLITLCRDCHELEHRI